MSITVSSRNDPVLGPLIDAEDEASRERALETVVVTHAEPIARRVIARYRSGHSMLSREDGDDVAATVRLRLVRRLRALPSFGEDAVERLEDYVATLTYHTIYDVLRRRFPERMRLKNRIRYLLGHDGRFVVRQTLAGTACGLASWGDAPRAATKALRAADWDVRQLPRERPADAVARLLEDANRPLLLDEIVRVLADVWSLGRPRVEELTLTRPQPNPASHAEAREFLGILWREVLSLRAPQRAALLLNLRDPDNGNAVALLVLLGIATFDEIAAALEITEEALAELWSALPIDDNRIASMLGVTRQQVINLRKAARARLARRMAGS
jgi:hypothetical protein